MQASTTKLLTQINKNKDGQHHTMRYFAELIVKPETQAFQTLYHAFLGEVFVLCET
jgi:hypothetical protein